MSAAPCCHACDRAQSLTRIAVGLPIGSVMIVCSVCGNKRCPKANNHNFACTHSNEPGQQGSAY